MQDKTCTMVTAPTQIWVHLPIADRGFGADIDDDGEFTGWFEIKTSWVAWTRHMMYAEELLEEQPIPETLTDYLKSRERDRENV